MTLNIEKEALEKACKGIIEAILFCLPNAYKGTVYRIGDPPALIATRVTSGILDPERKHLSWGLPERSDYNPPGKPWLQYRDEPGRPLEAMAWCVERQRSWTAESPKTDSRSVRLQVEGVWEDCHHMEPVLIRKEDVYLDGRTSLQPPRNIKGKPLWVDSAYIVAAVIKIHFLPNTIKVGSSETKVIKRLSRSLGTQLLSYQLKQQSLEATQKLAEDRLHSCNILADALRNAITKSGLIFSLIKSEFGFLRQQWEEVLLRGSDYSSTKQLIIHELNETVLKISGHEESLGKDLIRAQNRFLELALPPESGEKWVDMQIGERWRDVLSRLEIDEATLTRVWECIEILKKTLHFGKDPHVLAAFDRMPKTLRNEWVDLIYQESDKLDYSYLDNVIEILGEPMLDLPYQEKSRTTLLRLKALAQIMAGLENDTNLVLREILNNHEKDADIKLLR